MPLLPKKKNNPVAAPFISGIGAVSSTGLTTAETLDSFRAARSRPGSLTLFESPLDLPVFEVTGFEAEYPYSDGHRTRELALHAGREAVEDAALDSAALAAARSSRSSGLKRFSPVETLSSRVWATHRSTEK